MSQIISGYFGQIHSQLLASEASDTVAITGEFVVSHSQWELNFMPIAADWAAQYASPSVWDFVPSETDWAVQYEPSSVLWSNSYTAKQENWQDKF